MSLSGALLHDDATIDSASATGPKAAPSVSLVVASRGPRAALAEALALVGTTPHRWVRVVVRAEPLPPELRAALLRSGAVYVEAPATASLAELRRLGVRATASDIVHIVDDVDALKPVLARHRAGDLGVPIEVIADAPSPALGPSARPVVHRVPFAASPAAT